MGRLEFYSTAYRESGPNARADRIRAHNISQNLASSFYKSIIAYCVSIIAVTHYQGDYIMNTTNTTATVKTARKVVSKPLTDEQKKARAAKAAATKATNSYSFIALASKTIGDFLLAGSAFYGSALAYHRNKATVFPRPRNAGEIARLSALPETAARAEVAAIIKQHDSRTLAAGNKTAQACFDLFMANRKA